MSTLETMTPAQIQAAVNRFPWQQEVARRLAHDLCLAVHQAEAFEARTNDPWSEESRLARGQWLQAVALADEFRDRISGSAPRVVADAVQRAEVAAERHGLSADASHDHGPRT